MTGVSRSVSLQNLNTQTIWEVDCNQNYCIDPYICFLMTHAHRLTCRLKVRAHTTAHDDLGPMRAWVRCLNAHADALATWQNAQRLRAFQQIRRNLRVSRRVVQQVHEVKVGELAMKLQVEHGQRAPMQPAGSVLQVRSQRWPSEGRSALCRQLCGRSWSWSRSGDASCVLC